MVTGEPVEISLTEEEKNFELKSLVEKVDWLYDQYQILLFRLEHPHYPGGEAGNILVNAMKKRGETWDCKTMGEEYKKLVKDGKIQELR